MISLSTNEIIAQGSYPPRPVIDRSLGNKIRSRFLHEISQKGLLHSIRDELIINVDHTSSKFLATDNITMADEGQKHISRACSSDKRSITLTVSESLHGKILPFQLIFKGKTQRLLQTVDFPDRFTLE